VPRRASGCAWLSIPSVALIDEASVVVHHQSFLETGERFWI